MRLGFKLFPNKNEDGFAMPTVIMLTVVMSLVAFAALIQANNGLTLSYKQAYIQMARVASKAAVDYAQEQFDTTTGTFVNGACTSPSPYAGTPEQDLVVNDRYRLTFKAEVLSTSADGLEKTIKGTGSIYLPKTSATATYVFDIRSEIVRTFASCKTPDNYAPKLWLDASTLNTLFVPGAANTTTSTSTSSFGSAGSSNRDTMEERVDNGTQTSASWQSTDFEMHTCDSTEFTPSSVCTNTSTRYLYAGMIFSNVNVPQGADITSAVINYDCASGGAAGPLTHRIYGMYKTATNLHPDPFAFPGTNQLRNAVLTSASTTLSTNNCPPGNGNTMDVTSIVQEIVDNGNWNPNTGNGRMGFRLQRVSGNGSRRFNKNNIRLVVNYTSAGAAQPSTANNNPIGEWHDLSGNGNHAIFTYGNLPTRVDNQINGRTVVRFNNGAMLSALNSVLTGREMTVFAVVKANYGTSASDGRVISGMTNTTADDTVGTTSIIPLLRNGSSSGFSSVYASLTANNRTDFTCGVACASLPYIYNTVFRTEDADDTLAQLRGEGQVRTEKSGITPSGTPPYTYSINQLYIGGRRTGLSPGTGTNYFNGDYAELIVYDYALTCREIESVEEYLRSKWNTSSTQFTSTCPADLIPTL